MVRLEIDGYMTPQSSFKVNSPCYEKFVLGTPLSLIKCFVTPGPMQVLTFFTWVTIKVSLMNFKIFLMIIRSYICTPVVIMSRIDLPSVPPCF